MKKWLKRLGHVGIIILAVMALELILPIARTPINQFLGRVGIKAEFTIGMAGTAYAATADYTVDGTADDVQAQAALNALPSTGGKLIFYGGNYDFDALVSRAINNVVIAGSGKASYFARNATDPLFSAGSQTGWMFQDLRTDAGFITLSSAGDTILLNVWNGTSFIDKTTAAGSTVPATPITNQMFLHTPTGRTVLMQYDGSNWNPIQSYGTMTIYVDGTDGTDAIDKGGAVDAGAFATLQYAINCVPSYFGGEVNIYLAAGTYTEDITISGKTSAGVDLIHVIGSMTQVTTGVATGGTQGSGANAPKVTGTYSARANEGKLIHFTSGSNNDLYRVIGYTTTTNMFLDGLGLNAQPLNGDTYEILDWGTVISGETGLFNQAKIQFDRIKLSDTSGSYVFVAWAASEAVFYECSIVNSGTMYGLVSASSSTILIYDSYISYTGNYGVEAQDLGTIEAYGLKVYGSGTGVGMSAKTNGIWSGVWGCESSGGQIALQLQLGGRFMSQSSAIYSYLHGASVYGIQSLTGSGVVKNSQVIEGKFIDNTTTDANGTNENIDSTNYAFIAS